MMLFITGNQDKADFLANWLDVELDHKRLDLDELQSFDLHEIAEHKARQAYDMVGQPVLVEDVALSFTELGKLPGPYIKWFLQELSLEKICELAGTNSRAATASVCFCYFDGTTPVFFDGSVDGTIAAAPHGNEGFGFDPIFIPAGSNKTWGEMNDDEIEQFGLRTTTVYPALREYFAAPLDK